MTAAPQVRTAADEEAREIVERHAAYLFPPTKASLVLAIAAAFDGRDEELARVREERDRWEHAADAAVAAAVKATTAAEARVLAARRAGREEAREELRAALNEAGLGSALEALGPVEWGSIKAKPDAEHVADFADSLRITREGFHLEGDQPLHGVYKAGTETVVCHTGTSPNSANHARIIVGLLNHALAALPDPVEAVAEPAEVDPWCYDMEKAPAGREHPYDDDREHASCFVLISTGYHVGVGYCLLVDDCDAEGTAFIDRQWVDETGEEINPEPTAWMPLPAPPRSPIAAKG